MANLAVVVVCFALGILLRSSGRLPADSHKVLNAFIIQIALPALILRQVHGLSPDSQLLLPAATRWVMFALGALFFAVLGRLAGWSRETVGGLVLVGGLANTSFVGLPMIEAFYGPQFLAIGVLADQLGSYLVLSTLGVLCAVVCSAGDALSPRALLRRVITFPPCQAMALSLLLWPFEYPPAFVAVLDRLAATVTPLALVSVGYQLRFAAIGGSLRELSAGLFYKLLLGPALIALLFVLGLRAHGVVAQVTVFEAAMGPMIGGAIVAMDHRLNPPLVTLMVGLGIPLSLLTAAVWSQVLSGV
jgi:predicted permease